ncbi:hypothetical protein N2152v2_001299 [Parachlorella kessleri]
MDRRLVATPAAQALAAAAAEPSARGGSDDPAAGHAASSGVPTLQVANGSAAGSPRVAGVAAPQPGPLQRSLPAPTYLPAGEGAPAASGHVQQGTSPQQAEQTEQAAPPPHSSAAATRGAGAPLRTAAGVGGLPAMPPRRPRVLLGVTGSVATIKLPILARLLLQECDVIVVTTKASRYFFQEEQLPPDCRPVLGDEDEWRQWGQVGDPVVHIELRRWADAFVIAPLSANTLAKVAGGLCDNLLTCVVRAWDFDKPLLVAPAMNTFMWESPFTERHLAACRGLGIALVPPVSKRLACGDVGSGGMASPEDIAAACRQHLVGAGLLPAAGG